ncbi:hypothetical protein [Persicitalea jodogahamensis]|uniref:hypothetical protein n=1 Tax=Persicitalea jodogahamensis TaxID=402147 RepID=UPI00367286D0
MKISINSAWSALLVSFSLGNCCCQKGRDGLRLSVVAAAPTHNVIAAYGGYDKGGNTSIIFDDHDSYKWSGGSECETDSWGYFTATGQEISYIKRDRDLGQTFLFSGKTPKTLTAITVSTGYGSNVVRPNTYQKPVSIQLYEVAGEPILNDNGSDPTTEAFHGFPHNRPGGEIAPLRDDYFTGETYTPLAVFSGAVFPGKTSFGFVDETVPVPPGHPSLKGRLLRFELPADKPVVLRPGKRYAFLIMLDKRGAECGFTLANNFIGNYAGGHGIRRDGNGVFPPAAADPTKPFDHPANARAYESAHFPADFRQRIAIPPGTNGYPDVCAWRDLTFYVEAN